MRKNDSNAGFLVGKINLQMEKLLMHELLWMKWLLLLLLIHQEETRLIRFTDLQHFLSIKKNHRSEGGEIKS